MKCLFSAIPCALRHLPKDMIAPESTPFRYADNRPKMWTFIRTLFSHNIVVSRACAATHKNGYYTNYVVYVHSSVYYGLEVKKKQFNDLYTIQCCCTVSVGHMLCQYDFKMFKTFADVISKTPYSMTPPYI